MQYVNSKVVPSDTLENRESLHNENNRSAHALDVSLGGIVAAEGNNTRSLPTHLKYFIPFIVSNIFPVKRFISLRGQKAMLTCLKPSISTGIYGASTHKNKELSDGTQPQDHGKQHQTITSGLTFTLPRLDKTLVFKREVGKSVGTWLHALSLRRLLAPDF